jgi:hypothetical protein
MQTTRIPTLANNSRTAARKWLTQMHESELLFHPDNNPYELVQIADGSPTFTPQECEEASQALKLMFLHHGDAVYELAMDAVSRTFHTPAERKAIAALNG